MSDQNVPITRIALVGKSHALWPVALLLQQSLPQSIQLIIVEQPDDPHDIAGLTLPMESRFHQAIGLPVEDLFRHCDANMGLGTDCKNWMGEGSRFFVAPSGDLPMINNIPLHHIMLRASMIAGDTAKLPYLMQPFRFCARAAMERKFSLPAAAPHSPMVMLGPIIQCDRGAYTRLLKSRFQSDEKAIVQSNCVGVNIAPADGRVNAVQLANGQNIAADLFIDVSGALDQLLPDDNLLGRHLLSDIMPFDRKISALKLDRSLTDDHHSSVIALTGGVRVDTPLGTGMISELLYSSEIWDDKSAQEQTGVAGEAMAFEAFYTDSPWTGNVVRLGEASAALGPYQSADMRLLHEQSFRLMSCIPTGRTMDIEADEFNRRHKIILEELRDFAILPYLRNGRQEDFWADIPASITPESLRLRIDQFKSRGRFVPYDDALFDDQNWIDLLIGFEVIPERYDPRVRAIDMRKVIPTLKEIVDNFTQTIAAMPAHADYQIK